LPYLAAERIFDALADQRVPAARLACRDHVRESQSARVDAALLAPVDEVKPVGRRATDAGRAELLNSPDQPLGVAGADRDDGAADLVEPVINSAGDERTGVEADGDA